MNKNGGKRDDFCPQFLPLASNHSLVPVYGTLIADLETPVSAFLRLAEDEPECFCLESVEGGAKVGRYTFIGVRPYCKIVARGRSIVVTEKGKRRSIDGDAFLLLKEMLGGHKPASIPGSPPFTAGAVGFFAYDIVRQIERLPELAKDDLGVFILSCFLTRSWLSTMRARRSCSIVTANLSARKPVAAYEDAVKRLGRLERRLARPIAKLRRASVNSRLQYNKRTSKKEFMAGVSRIKKYIAAGDIFQAVLSQRFEVQPGVDPFSIYRALRIVNPSPYLYFLRFRLDGAAPSTGLLGSSPELLVRVAHGHVDYRPIAGTRPRSLDEEEDARIEQELLRDEKERAEHVMLVDLGATIWDG